MLNGGLILAGFLLLSYLKLTISNLVGLRCLAKPAKWSSNLWTSLFPTDAQPVWIGILLSMGLIAVLFALAARWLANNHWRFVQGFPFIFAGATMAFILSSQSVIDRFGLESALWALLAGLAISNTIGTPRVFQPAVQTELYIKTGLVLLGAEILVSKLIVLGTPGIFVAWLVTPVVLVSTFWFGQRILKIESPSLNMVISADMSVCGVSAAIATAAACRAKKEELSLAIGMSLCFTVVMMVGLPALIKALQLDPVIGGAWIGGTIDSTGAVAAAGEMLGDAALDVATTIKMIQNILIGVVSFFVALYWVAYQERGDAAAATPSAMEIWRRFPKFVLGFLAASLLFSAIFVWHPQGASLVAETVQETKTLRSWLFCLAFFSIGLETRFANFVPYMRAGKPLVLYIAGQSLNLCLTLLMAWIMFAKVFPHAAESLRK